MKISRAYNFCLSIIPYFKLKVTSILRISTKVFSLQFSYIHFQDTTYEIKNDANVFGLSQILIELSLFNDVNFLFFFFFLNTTRLPLQLQKSFSLL